MARPVIAFLTDFGLQDHYVGVMKGVALDVCPEATLVDITHEIPPHDIVTAALQLGVSYSYFPRGAVFLVVVDPGVGTSRRALAVEADGYRFVGPDNGVFSTVLDAAQGATRIVEIMNVRAPRPVGRTFEGRDRFAPAAAMLASGVALADLGPEIEDPVRLFFPRPVATSSAIDGVVIHVDRFGNLITNIRRSMLDQVGNAADVSVDLAGRRIGTLATTYGDVASGALTALFGSSDLLEIAVRDGSAERELQTGRGAAVRVNIGRL